MMNTYFLWTIACQTRKKSLPVLLELPVRVSVLLHCPRTYRCFFVLLTYKLPSATPNSEELN